MSTPLNGISGTLGNGLAAYWSFDGDYLDKSGNGNHLLLASTEDVQYDEDNKYCILDASITPYEVETASPVVNYPNSASYRPFSVSTWVKAPSGLASGTFFHQNYGTNKYTLINLRLSSLDRMRAYCGASSAYVDFEAPRDEWVNVTGVHTGTELLIYVNGVYVDVISRISQMVYVQTDPVKIGRNYTSPNTVLNVAEFRVYNDVALTEDQIKEIYSMGMNYEPQPLKWYGDRDIEIYIENK